MSKKPDLLTAIRESPGIHSMVYVFYSEWESGFVIIGIMPFVWHFQVFCVLSDLIRCCQILSVFVRFFFVRWVSNIQFFITVNFLKSCFRALSVKSWMFCQLSASTTAFSSPTCWPFTPGLRKKTREQRSLSTPNAGVTTNAIILSQFLLFCFAFSPSWWNNILTEWHFVGEHTFSNAEWSLFQTPSPSHPWKKSREASTTVGSACLLTKRFTSSKPAITGKFKEPRITVRKYLSKRVFESGVLDREAKERPGCPNVWINNNIKY